MKRPRRDDHSWQSIDIAAVRLGCHAGHIRRLCQAWAEISKARRVRGGGRKWHWEVRTDAQLLDVRERATPASDVTLRLGAMSISVRGDCDIGIKAGAVSIAPAGKGSLRGNSAAIEGHTNAVRRPFKTGAIARRSASV